VRVEGLVKACLQFVRSGNPAHATPCEWGEAKTVGADYELGSPKGKQGSPR
jgi:hypothetical protein